MFNNPKRPRPRWPPTRTKGMFLIILGGGFLLILVIMLVNVLLFSLGPMFVILWQTQGKLDPLTDDVVATISLMALGMVGVPLLGLVGFGVGLVIWGRNTLRHDKRLQAYGQIARAEIIDRWARWGYRSSWHCVAYRFRVLSADGAPQTHIFAERNPQAYYQLHIGDEVPLRYLPDDPSICRLELS